MENAIPKKNSRKHKDTRCPPRTVGKLFVRLLLLAILILSVKAVDGDTTLER